MNLLEKLKPEFRELIKSGEDNLSYNIAIKALERKKSWRNLDMYEVIAISHFTHPDRPITLLEIIELFKD